MSAHSQDLLSISQTYASMPSDKRRLFRERVAQLGLSTSSLPIIAIAEQPSRLPLSYAQEGVWHRVKNTPEPARWNISGKLCLNNKIDNSAARRAMTDIVKRHSILRTIFEESAGIPYQIVGHDPVFEWNEYDFGLEDGTVRDQAVQERLDDLAAAPFDLSKGPLLRVSLIAIDTKITIFHITAHILIVDPRSLNIIFDEFFRFYEPGHDRATTASQSLSLQYADYALWQREWIDTPSLQAQLDYWRTKLTSAHDRQSALPTFINARDVGGVSPSCSVELVSRLRELARYKDAGLPEVFLTVFFLTLHKCGATNGVRIGFETPGRKSKEAENLVGLFANLLILDLDLEETSTFNSLLPRVKGALAEAISNSDVHFTQINEFPSHRPASSGAIRCPFLFNYVSSISSPSRPCAHADVASLWASWCLCEPNITLTITERGSELQLSFSDATDLATHVNDRWLGEYVAALEMISMDQPSAMRPSDAGNIFSNNVIRLNSGRAKTNIFVIHPFHGFVFDYIPLAETIRKDVNLFGLQFPWYLAPENWPKDFNGLASLYVQSIRTIQGHGPYRLLAWSLGGLLAVEIAYILEQQGAKVEFIGLVDAMTPDQRQFHANGNTDQKVIASDDDRSQFWMMIRNKGWKHYFSQIADLDITDNMIAAIRYIHDVTVYGFDRCLHSHLYVWLANKPAQPANDTVLSSWTKTTLQVPRLIRVIDADHFGIIAHHELAQSLLEILSVYPAMDTSS